MASEQGLKRKATSGLQSLPKKGRMSDMASMMVVRQAEPVMTARERALTQEKERQRLKAEKEERKRYFRDLRSEAAFKIERAEREKEDSKKISGWIETIPECPVFKPTEEEFKDPLKYIKGVEDKVAAKYGICKIIPPYVDDVFSGRSKFKDVDFTMEVRKQPLKMVDWDKKENTLKGVDFNKDKKTWTFKDLEKFANEFVEKNYEGSSSQLQYRFIEREFWKEFLLRQNKYVRYASDVPGTAFDAWEELARSDWNLGKLPRLDDSVLRNVDMEIPGVTVPMLYVGMLFSMFAWHVEDQYLYSINYHHLGAPKTWYGVPGCAAQDFERVAAEKVFNLPRTEEGLARTLRLLIGKTIMFPPGLLVEAQVPVCRAVQQPGEYVVTFPRSYHAGYSNGFNCGEAVNFAMPDWFPYGVACARRYRLLQQVQVVAHDELLCKEAQDLQTRMKGESGAPPYQPTQMDVHTMVEFVRLMRWQHRERWKLQQRGAAARALDQLAGSTSMVCSVCYHKNYFGFVLCGCTAGLPICFNHPDVLRACACHTQPSVSGGGDPARTVMYLPELPLLEMTARDFEGQPGIRKRVAAAAQAGLDTPELKDEWELGKQREEPMEAVQPAVEQKGIDMSKYVEWAPIEGYNYEDVLRLKTIQPGTLLQQRGEALAGASRENSQEGSPNPGPLLLTDSPANEDQLLTAVNEALPSAGLQAPTQHALPPAPPKTLAPTALDKSPDAPADGGAVGQGVPKESAGSASELSDGGDSQETLVQVESDDSGVGQKKQGRGARKRKVREGMGGAPMDGNNAAGGARPELAAESIGAVVGVGSEEGTSRGGLGKAKKNKGVRSASEKRRRKTVLVSSDDSGELQEAEVDDEAAEVVSKDDLEMLATLVRGGQVLTVEQLKMALKDFGAEGVLEGGVMGRLLALSKKQKRGPPAAVPGGPDVLPGEKDMGKAQPRLTEKTEPRKGGPPAEPGTEVLVGSRQTEEEQGAAPEERAQEADDAQAEERQQEAPGGSAAGKRLEADLGRVPSDKLATVSTLEAGAFADLTEAQDGEANGQPGGAVEMKGECGAGGGETLPQPESQLLREAAVELDDGEEKQPGKDADENGVSQEEVLGTSVATEGEGRGETDIAEGVADAPGAEAMTPGLGGGEDEEAMREARVLAADSAKSWSDAGKSVATEVAGADGTDLDRGAPESGSGKGPGREEKGAASIQGGLQAAEQEAYSAGGTSPSVQEASADLEMVRGREEMRDAAAAPGFNVALSIPTRYWWSQIASKISGTSPTL